MAFEIKPIKGDFGGEVRGVDPGLEVDDETLRELEAAWYRHSILVFRSLAMSPDQHIAFTRRLGKLHIMEPLEYNLEGHPEVLVVSNARTERRPLGLRGAGMGFHTDGEDKAIPNAGSFLYALKIPPEGGDTLFSDLYAAYAALPDDSKRAIAGKRARFSRISLHNVNYPHLPPLTEDQKRDRPDVLHPLVRRHPRSGRTALFIGRWACDIEGLPREEGEDLVHYLQEFTHRPEFVYRHRWREGDGVLWDNRCTQHCATPFDESRYVRHMYRTTLDGETPVMASDPPFE